MGAWLARFWRERLDALAVEIERGRRERRASRDGPHGESDRPDGEHRR